MKILNYCLKLSLSAFLLFSMGCQNSATNEKNEIIPKDPYAVTKDEVVTIATNVATDLSLRGEKDANGKMSRGGVREIEKMSTEKSKSGEAYYVINYKNSAGFVLVAADKRLQPVLAFSDNGKFNVEKNLMPEGLIDWTEDLKSNVDKIRTKNKEQDKVIQIAWERYSAGTDKYTQSVTSGGYPGSGGSNYEETKGPMISTIWNQDNGYNFFCPVASGGPCNKAYTGCVATAMAQVMKYHNYASGFNFGIMPNQVSGSCSPNSGEQEVAALMKKAGQSVNMNWGASGSAAYTSNVPDALKNWFGYSSDATYIQLNPVGITQVENDIKYNNRVVIFRGESSFGNHAWVGDGYKRFVYYDSSTGNYYSYLPYWHMNWGWGGASNGWFRSDDYSLMLGNGSSSGTAFNTDKCAVIGIHP